MKAKAKCKPKSDLVKRLKEWREKNGLSQRQAAEIMMARGVPVMARTLQSWEVGDRSPGPMAAKLLEVFLAANRTIEVTDRPVYPKVASVVSKKDVGRIRKLREAGKTLKAIAREFGISESAVSRICAGNRHVKTQTGSGGRLAKDKYK